MTFAWSEMNYGTTFIKYKQLSEDLGLHKSSYNFLSKIQNENKMKNINKLRHLYQTIETGKSKATEVKTRNVLAKSTTSLTKIPRKQQVSPFIK